jgi:tetratricopeptide (TPR) repeat protein
LQLASDDAGVVQIAATIFSLVEGNFPKGAMLADRGVELNPNLANAWNVRAWISLLRGQYVSALDDFARALRLNPIDPLMAPFIFYGNALTCFFLSRPEEGIAWAEKTLLYRPGDTNGLLSVAINAQLAGRTDKVLEAVNRVRELQPTLTVSYIKQVWRPDDQGILYEALDRLGLPE